ncbi:pirin family protein [Salinibacterium sp. SYSU T00001]|uniref:pirin family protein n=1 Tax=Homoserinimonas sedimenticola TaxID=2986805 RepID=UPI00223626FD|nr:pirin family protein [Salinibacterium sedimenticola]MCW4385396.1 pirin family protein [Salinibacterium sedimenticola]
MTNLDERPSESLGVSDPSGDGGVAILEPRDVPLGGPRAMNVRRTLPQRGRSLIGAWCFLDHYGPDDVNRTGGMVVPPHPHTGLQTVTWLFAGEVEHRDSSGGHAVVRPGELNLMTAGRGIQHSEVSVGAGTGEPGATDASPEHGNIGGQTVGTGASGSNVLHGVQLWTALPDATRHSEPFFEHTVPPVITHQGAQVSVFLGSLLGQTSDATTFSPLVGAQFDIPPATEIVVPVEAGFEHGVLLDTGEVTVDDVPVPRDHLAYRAPGADALVLAAGASGARVVLIGGEPLGEQIVMWWNFIGRTHEEVVAYRKEWQRDVIEGADAAGRFGHTVYDGPALPAPALPTVRLRSRG